MEHRSDANAIPEKFGARARDAHVYLSRRQNDFVGRGGPERW